MSAVTHLWDRLPPWGKRTCRESANAIVIVVTVGWWMVLMAGGVLLLSKAGPAIANAAQEYARCPIHITTSYPDGEMRDDYCLKIR